MLCNSGLDLGLPIAKDGVLIKHWQADLVVLLRPVAAALRRRARALGSVARSQPLSWIRKNSADLPAGRSAKSLRLPLRRRASRPSAWNEKAPIRGLWRTVVCSCIIALAIIIPAHAEFVLPQPTLADPLTIAADTANRFRQGSYDVWLLRGNCYLNQGLTYVRGRDAVLWIEPGEPLERQPTKVIAYFEGDVQIDYQQPVATGAKPDGAAARVTDRNWFGQFETIGSLKIDVPDAGPEPKVMPAIFHRGVQRFNPDRTRSVRLAQLTEPGPGSVPVDPVPLGMRRIRGFRRSDVPVQIQWSQSPSGDQSVAVITSGVSLIIDGLDIVVDNVGVVDSVALATDRMVVWTSGDQPDLLSGQALQNNEVPLEIYMEGNIEFRMGDRVIYADRMYYDVQRNVGMVIAAELLTPIPEYQGLLRLKAYILRQLDASRFVAQDGMITTSRMGEPSYHFQAETIMLEDIQRPVIDPLTGLPQVNPQTNEPLIDHQHSAQSTNNFLYVSGVPVFYWPTLATDLKKPTYYVDQVRLENDSIFGTQLLLDLDAYQLLGIREPPVGTEWLLNLDYLSKRGFGTGTEFHYDRPNMFGLPGGGPAAGFLDAWVISDDGLDNLGRDRRRLVPEEDFRGRALWNHRQHLSNNLTLSAELGWISDRNFLEQFYETEWDELKDQATGFELKQIFDNQSWSVTTDVRLNDFFTQTEWLPRLDHFWMGQPLWNDRLTWFEHSHAGYARLRTATVPINAADAAKFDPLAWESLVEGERVATRQELDWPLMFGPVKFVPYAMGEFAHWGEDLTGNDLQRFYFQTGARASIPFWAVNPAVEDPLLNVHGLAHKVVFDAEFSYADANQNLGMLPLYDALDDDAIEHFRRRFFFDTFGGGPGGNVPLKFDERFYALRTGLQGNVSSPSTEIADDLTAVRAGMRHRWQTKRGPLGNRRIIDWIVLDTNASWFPDQDRDNFGQDLGLLDYDFRWHIGDRLTMLSTGAFDFFGDGLRAVTIGGHLTRPPRGSAYAGIRSLEGPISSNVLAASYSYWMSPKWISTFGSSVDLGSTGNIGQNFSVTRIGESLLVTLGFNVDRSKDNLGVHLLVEPRFLPKSRVNRTPGIHIPPPGALGLE